MAGKQRLLPYGLFLLGQSLDRLEWALATRNQQPAYISTYLQPLLQLSQAYPFEFIGEEATNWHDLLSNLGESLVPDKTRNALRHSITRWRTLVTERLQDLYLVTPMTTLEPKRLIGGLIEILPAEDIVVLEYIELVDLDAACLCILMGCSTAAEFSTLRAAESLLRRWYEKKTGKRIERKTWGAVLDRLETEYPNEKQRPKEIVLLNYLLLRRNEVDHPERVSSQQDAETTLMNVCNLIRGVRVEWTKLPEAPEPSLQSPMPVPELQSETSSNQQ